MPLEIIIDRGACMGARECVFHAPGVFATDASRKSVVVDPLAADREAILEAAFHCPNFAIDVIEDGKSLL